MTQNKYVLAIDVGERRIGLALASTIARLPAPYKTLDTTLVSDVFQELSRIIDEQHIGVAVVGLPRGMQGNDTQQTDIARKFAAELAQHSNIPIVMQDEAATSIEAERLLKNHGKPYKKADIDSGAAAIILQDYLNQSARNMA